jgi:hypothetical protein
MKFIENIKEKITFKNVLIGIGLIGLTAVTVEFIRNGVLTLGLDPMAFINSRMEG